MRKMMSWRMVLVVLGVFVMNMVIMPGFATTAMAFESTPVSGGTAPAAAAAGETGAEAGAAVFAGLTAGQIVAGAVFLGAAAAWTVGAASNSTSTTAHH